MARTVGSVARRGDGGKERGGGKKVGTRRDDVEVQKGPEEGGQKLGEEREEEGMSLGEGREEVENLGVGRGEVENLREEGRNVGRRVRKGVSPFQFGDGHTLFSQTSAKYKSKNLAVKNNREKRMQSYRKKHFSELRRKIKELDSLAKKRATQLKAQSRKIKSLQAKK